MIFEWTEALAFGHNGVTRDMAEVEMQPIEIVEGIGALCVLILLVSAAVFLLCYGTTKLAKVPGAPAVILGILLMIGGAVIAGFHGAVIGLLIGIFVLVFSLASRNRTTA